MTRLQSTATRLHAEGLISNETRDNILAAMPRPCVCCAVPFWSLSVANRVCRQCKADDYKKVAA